MLNEIKFMVNETNTWIGGTGLERILAVCAIGGLVLSIVKYKSDNKKDGKNKLEERRDMFYIPLQNALNELNVNQIMDWTKKIKILDKKELNYKIAIININNSVCEFKDKCNKIIPYISLASDETTEKLELFMSIFDKNDFFKEKIVDFKKAHPYAKEYKSKTLDSIMQKGCVEQYNKDSEHILDYYEKLQSAIDKDIELLKANLAKLVNQ